MPPKVHTAGLPKLRDGQRYVSGAEVFKDQIKDLPKRTLEPHELRDAFEPVFQSLAETPLPADPKKRLAAIDDLSNTHRLAAYGYPATFMKVCLGQLSKPKLWELIGSPPDFPPAAAGGGGGSCRCPSLPAPQTPPDSGAQARSP